MAGKENKGGNLTNAQVEQDNKVKGKQTTENHYQGSQDTGDQIVRNKGNEVQRNDGLPKEDSESNSE